MKEIVDYFRLKRLESIYRKGTPLELTGHIIKLVFLIAIFAVALFSFGVTTKIILFREDLIFSDYPGLIRPFLLIGPIIWSWIGGFLLFTVVTRTRENLVEWLIERKKMKIVIKK